MFLKQYDSIIHNKETYPGARGGLTKATHKYTPRIEEASSVQRPLDFQG